MTPSTYTFHFGCDARGERCRYEIRQEDIVIAAFSKTELIYAPHGQVNFVVRKLQDADVPHEESQVVTTAFFRAARSGRFRRLDPEPSE